MIGIVIEIAVEDVIVIVTKVVTEIGIVIEIAVVDVIVIVVLHL